MSGKPGQARQSKATFVDKSVFGSQEVVGKIRFSFTTCKKNLFVNTRFVGLTEPAIEPWFVDDIFSLHLTAMSQIKKMAVLVVAKKYSTLIYNSMKTGAVLSPCS